MGTSTKRFSVLFVSMVVLSSMTMSGCLTAAPSLQGKSRVFTRFQSTDPDTIDATTGQTLKGQTVDYEHKLGLPAGQTLEGNDNMTYEIAPDGTWRINVGQAGKSDTTKQATVLGQGVQAQTQLLTVVAQAVAEAVVQAMQLAAPIVGAHVEAQDQQAAQAQQDKQAMRQGFLQLLQDPTFRQQLIDGLKPPTPVVPTPKPATP